MISAALHLTLAALAYCLLAGDIAPLGVAFALLLGLAPDLDTPKSLVGSLARSISVPLERRVGHRTTTHSLFALLLVAGAAYLVAPGHWRGLAGAYGSHLLLDLLIGVQGIQLFWPSGEFLTLTAWRDDGPAPRVLLGLAAPALVIFAAWGQLAPLLTPAVSAAVAVANPIATPHPSPTLRPSVQLRFALPPGVGLSALRVRRGDTIREGSCWRRGTRLSRVRGRRPCHPQGRRPRPRLICPRRSGRRRGMRARPRRRYKRCSPRRALSGRRLWMRRRVRAQSCWGCGMLRSGRLMRSSPSMSATRPSASTRSTPRGSSWPTPRPRRGWPAEMIRRRRSAQPNACTRPRQSCARRSMHRIACGPSMALSGNRPRLSCARPRPTSTRCPSGSGRRCSGWRPTTHRRAPWRRRGWPGRSG